MRFVEDGSYSCGIFSCEKKARHPQCTVAGTLLLCDDHFGKMWKFSELGMKRLKGEVE